MKCGYSLRSQAGARRAAALPERTANRFKCPRTTLTKWYGNLSSIHISSHHDHADTRDGHFPKILLSNIRAHRKPIFKYPFILTRFNEKDVIFVC